jgi:glycine C-acetyltransferase
MAEAQLTNWIRAQMDDLRARNLFRYPRVHEAAPGGRLRIDGREVVQLSSNNYLGLANHPRVVEGARRALEKYGAGTGAVRTISGTMDIHLACEEKIAKFKGCEAALIFQSGYTANVGTVSTLTEAGDLIVSDELNHASIIDGCRLSKAARAVYRHCDYAHLDEVLAKARGADGITGKILVVTDGVFSMDGDQADLKQVLDVCKKHHAVTMVDDAHATGVLGRGGRGTVDHCHVHDDWDITIGTLSKAVGVMGGYFAGAKEVRDFLLAKARPILFSSSHPPAVIGAISAAFDVMTDEPQHHERLWENAKFFKAGLKELGFDTGNSTTPVTPVMAGTSERAAKLSSRLFEEGVFAQGIYFPMVAENKSRVRTIVSAAHTKADLGDALAAFRKVGKELGLI